MESSKELVRQYFMAYESGDQSNVNLRLHPSHLYYPPGGGKPIGLEDRIRSEAYFFSAFSEIQVTILDQIEEGDRIANRILMNCLHSGEYTGIPPTSKRIGISYISVLRIKDSKVLVEWAEFDSNSIIQQIK